MARANQASLLSAPELSAEAEQAQANVLRWMDTARRYVSTDEERAVFASLEAELDAQGAGSTYRVRIPSPVPAARRPSAVEPAVGRHRANGAQTHTHV